MDKACMCAHFPCEQYANTTPYWQLARKYMYSLYFSLLFD